MNQFETADWSEENKEEKWTSGLFEQSNAKIKTTKIRRRNKYPKGFAKCEVSSETKKANSSAALKSPKSEVPNESSSDQKEAPTSKKKRKKGNTEGFAVMEHDASEPPLKAQKTGDKAHAKNSLANSDKEKKIIKKKHPDGSKSVKQSDGEGAVKAAESNKSSTSEDSGTSRNAIRRKKRKNKGLSDIGSDANELPAKVKKLTENSTVKDDSCANSANESVPQVTPKKRKRNRKKKKSTSLENAEDKKPVSESPAQESETTKTTENKESELTPSQRRRARKKRERERKAKEDPNFKVNKKRKRRKRGKESVGEEKPKNGDLQSEDVKETGDATNEENLEASKKSKEKKKKKKKSLESAVEQNSQSNDSSEELNESLETWGVGESPAESKPKKKKRVKGKNVSENQTSPSMKLGNEEKEDTDSEEESSDINEDDSKEVDVPKVKKKKGLSLREKMEEKLRGARFRFLNEQLYTSKSGDTSKYFLIEPESFKAYHDGYKQQLNQWPVKPIDMIIRSLKKKPANLVIADFGCGDAQLSKALPNKVHSFDHVALNERVTVCDMAKTPLGKASMDVVVFCLSLMGSNLSDYIAEANRVLKMGGLMKIAEVESRFDDVGKFVNLMGKFGFLCTRQDLSNDYFYLFDFRKEKNIKVGKVLPSLELGACSYKKR